MNVKEGLSMLNYKEIDFDEVWFETMGGIAFAKKAGNFLMNMKLIFGKN